MSVFIGNKYDKGYVVTLLTIEFIQENIISKIININGVIPVRRLIRIKTVVCLPKYD